jgi:LuxR family transcriptional regulator
LAKESVVVNSPTPSRSIGGFARSDREFSDAEIACIVDQVRALHQLSQPPERLPQTQIDALRLVANGFRYSEAAHRIGISESALKARLRVARQRLMCRTTAEAIQRALEHKLI